MREDIGIQTFKRIIIEPLGDKPVLELTRKGCDLLNELKLTYWISAGSTLGLVRERCGYIKYDTDIDVEVLVDDKFHEGRLLEKFLDNDYELIRKMIYKNKTMQIAFEKDNVIFDIYFYYDSTTSNYINENECGTLLIPKRFVTNRSKYILKKDYDYIVPQPVEAYLEYRYGVTWRIPTGKKQTWSETAGEALQ